MFKINTLYYTDGYKVEHKAMLALGIIKLYGIWIPRSVKHAPKGITKIVSFGQQMVVKWLHDEFEENFFFSKERNKLNNISSFEGDVEKAIEIKKKEAMKFVSDISLHIGLEYDGKHFEDLWDLGYLPIKIKSLPEGIETNPNIPHMTFINTVDGFAWLTLYLETVISALAWKPSTSATIALQLRRNTEEWINKTDPDNGFLIDYMNHDFSARGLDIWSMISSGLGHATSHRGSDILSVIPAARYFYNELENEVCINSVIASEHNISTTKIFTVDEQQMLSDWMKIFPKGILSVVSDKFDLWKLITEYLPTLKEEILARDGKLVIRPNSGNPVEIICGINVWDSVEEFNDSIEKERWNRFAKPSEKGVIELLWDIFGGTINKQGYKVLDPHIGAIYGDSINPERQVEIYKRLEVKGFAATNIILNVGSYTYQYNTKDTFGFAAKSTWFEVIEKTINEREVLIYERKSYNIYKDPVIDDGVKCSLKGLLQVKLVDNEYIVNQECSWEQEEDSELKTIYENGIFKNQVTFQDVRNNLTKI